MPKPMLKKPSNKPKVVVDSKERGGVFADKVKKLKGGGEEILASTGADYGGERARIGIDERRLGITKQVIINTGNFESVRISVWQERVTRVEVPFEEIAGEMAEEIDTFLNEQTDDVMAQLNK